jgi:hypothetical protein
MATMASLLGIIVYLASSAHGLAIEEVTEDQLYIPVSLFVEIPKVNGKVDDISKAIEWRINTMAENGERFEPGKNGAVSKTND